MRFLLAGVGILAALVFMAASAAMNWVFLKSLGKTELEGQIFGAFSVALDVTKSLLPLFIGWAAMAKRHVYRTIASGVFLLLFVFALGSAVGFAALNRGAVTGGRDVMAARLSVVQRDAQKVEADMAALSGARPQAAISDALRGLEQDRRWQSTKSCTDATAGESRAFCEGYFKTKAELATAIERARLDARLVELRREVAALQDAGAGEENDPQASLLAKLTGVGVSTAQMALVIFIAVLVEVLAAFGLYLAVGWWPERERKVAQDAPHVVMPPRAAQAADAVPQLPRMEPLPIEDADYWSAPVRRLRLSNQS